MRATTGKGARMGMDVERRDLFATPFAVAVLPEAERINAAFSSEIHRVHRPAGTSGPGPYWKYPTGQSRLVVEAMRDLTAATLIVLAAMTGRQEDEDVARWQIASHFHVLDSGGSIAVHSHPAVAWEASYIVELSGRVAGAGASGASLGGELEFQDPRGMAPVMYAPDLTFRAPDGETLGVSRNLSVKPGLLAIYPGWLMHAVNVYRAKGQRLSVTLRLAPRMSDASV